ncbi:MAG: hydrogen gas-evolving membrane-bound hydrogenase subunit E [Eubacteriales bacterium]
MNKLFQKIQDFAAGDLDLCPPEKVKLPRRPSTHTEKSMDERFNLWHDQKVEQVFHRMYDVVSTVICLGVIAMLLITVSYLPPYGEASNPVNNEVSQRYLEESINETGATNAVAGMILDYRAFDTFGESAVLFVSSISVYLFLQNPPVNGKKVLNANYKPMKQNPVTQVVAKYLIPFLVIFGVYIILNGHISPGGGFAGGAIMGASLILYSAAYGYETVSKVITGKLLKMVTFFSLLFYALAKGYSFYTGAHHIETGVPLGTAGMIFSGGLILPLNICIGLIVTCTMYSFYSLFSKGEI